MNNRAKQILAMAKKDDIKAALESDFPGGQELVRQILALIGDDPTREGLIDTPYRVVKSWLEIFSGYHEDPAEILSTSFAADMEKVTDEIVMCKNIEFTSMCEHHMLPFSGVAHIGYLPKARVIGLSKLARVVECFACKLQIQEMMCCNIADAINDCLAPNGVGVIIEAVHLCMKCRGIKKSGASMVTSAMRGKFKSQSQTRNEFLQLIKN